MSYIENPIHKIDSTYRVVLRCSESGRLSKDTSSETKKPDIWE